MKVISLTSEGQEFPPLRPSEKKSHDGGVDLYTAATEDGRILCAQSKYKVRSKDDFDTIISKFKNYEASLSPAPSEPSLFSTAKADDQRTPVPTFALATSSQLDGILAKYEASTLASCDYYRELLTEKRLFLVDGPRILTLLQHLYKRTHEVHSVARLVVHVTSLEERCILFPRISLFALSGCRRLCLGHPRWQIRRPDCTEYVHQDQHDSLLVSLQEGTDANRF